ncbi:MAG TPA: hypothetical protein VEQ10_18430 [Vicinamibacteria bacterium]|nr:hypothetical protein [Vicinamibacteria bacterium]
MLRAGFDLHVAKPIRPAELVAAVASLVSRARQPRRQAAVTPPDAA